MPPKKKTKKNNKMLSTQAIQQLLKDVVLNAAREGPGNNKLVGKWISTEVLIAAVNAKYNFNNTSIEVNKKNIGKVLAMNNGSIDNLKVANAEGVYRIARHFRSGTMLFFFIVYNTLIY
jgi:hypothetical protein